MCRRLLQREINVQSNKKRYSRFPRRNLALPFSGVCTNCQKKMYTRGVDSRNSAVTIVFTNRQKTFVRTACGY